MRACTNDTYSHILASISEVNHAALLSCWSGVSFTKLCLISYSFSSSSPDNSTSFFFSFILYFPFKFSSNSSPLFFLPSFYLLHLFLFSYFSPSTSLLCRSSPYTLLISTSFSTYNSLPSLVRSPFCLLLLLLPFFFFCLFKVCSNLVPKL